MLGSTRSEGLRAPHRIAAGTEQPGPPRTVRVRAGQTERVTIELE